MKNKSHKPATITLDMAEYERLRAIENRMDVYRAAIVTAIDDKLLPATHALKKIILPPADTGDVRRIDLFSAISHLIGTGLSIAALVILVVFSATQGKTWHVVSFSIFGASLILMYLSSTLYHWFPYPSTVRSVFRRIDHSMIYLLIAGTYTPVCLTILRGGWGWAIFGVIWALAIWGIIVKAAWLKIPRIISSLSYIFMGWLIIIAFFPLTKALPLDGIAWMLSGGIIYTIGVIFYTLDKKYPSKAWFNFHDLFHLFILGGSFGFFWFMLQYVLPRG